MSKNNTAQYSLFPEITYEYFILLSPSEEIKIHVDQLKQQLHEIIGLDTVNLNSIAHITLFKYEGEVSMNIPETIKALLAGQKSFRVKLSGAGQFTSGAQKTLFLKVEDPLPINALLKLLKQKFKKIPGKITPHITIAKNIAQMDFDKIPDITAFDYYNEWLCDRISILRRPAGTTNWFSPVAEIILL